MSLMYMLSLRNHPLLTVLCDKMHARVAFSVLMLWTWYFFSPAYFFSSTRRKRACNSPTHPPPWIHNWAQSCVKKNWQAAVLNFKIFINLSCNSCVERGLALNINFFRQHMKSCLFISQRVRELMVRKRKSTNRFWWHITKCFISICPAFKTWSICELEWCVR